MKSLPRPLRILACIFWILAVGTFPIWLSVSHPGWDARVYARAMRWVAAGQDPYAAGIAQEEAYYAHIPGAGENGVPFAYVYSPITLPVLKLASAVPVRLLKAEYWLLYSVCALACILVTMRAAQGNEKRWMALMAPVAIFFPGLLVHDVVQSGNLAYILYGAALAAAWLGWKRANWLPFYCVVVAASCFKAPYLCLLAVPFFSARREILRTSIAAAAGVGLFAVQAWIWPVAFHNYLRAVELQFVWNRDFGISPAGQFGALLEALQYPFETAGWIFYALYALPVVAMLWILGRRFQRGALSLGEWMPVILLGAILLNPRHIEYDLAPLTLPLALIGLRLLERVGNKPLVIGLVAEHFVALNVVLQMGEAQWQRSASCVLLVCGFVGGCWDLVKRSERAASPARAQVQAINFAMGKLAG